MSYFPNKPGKYKVKLSDYFFSIRTQKAQRLGIGELRCYMSSVLSLPEILPMLRLLYKGAQKPILKYQGPKAGPKP